MEYLTHLAILFFIYAILGVSLNLVGGYTGLLSSAHAAFYGIGAYATAIALTSLHINFFFSLAAGIIITGIIAFLIGIVLSRFRGDYYALVSLGFNVIVYSVLLLAGLDPRAARYAGDTEARVCFRFFLQYLFPHTLFSVRHSHIHHLQLPGGLILRQGLEGHTGGRTGDPGLRLQHQPLQARDIRNLCRHGGGRRVALRLIHKLHKPFQLYRDGISVYPRGYHTRGPF